eukprot:m.1147428 g.1147428  ORF g.1147428 m.1147428 type:complete len:146 (-) comp24471_c0_seq15:5473-5910(-)
MATELERKMAQMRSPSQSPERTVFNPYTEFPEFSRKQIREYEQKFKEYDTGRDGFLDLMEIKLMMEKLGAPQTHKSLKEMIAEVDEDNDGKMSFREFLLVYRKAAAGDLQIAGLEKLASSCNVSEVPLYTASTSTTFEHHVYCQQ